MISEEERWRDSADIYAKLAPKISFYRETSEQIVAMASLGKGMSVVDLGCGSACLSTTEMLHYVPALKVIYCVDISEEMLMAAQRRVRSNIVEFIRCSAEDLDRILPEKVDRIICNSALWLFDLPRVLQAVRKVLLPTGFFLFNIAEWDFDFQEEAVSCDPKYEAIDRQLALHGLPKKQSRGAMIKLSVKQLQDILNDNGLCIIGSYRYTVSVSATDWLYFYQIPAIVKRSLPNIPLNIALGVLREAMDSLKKSNLLPIKWIAYKSKLE